MILFRFAVPAALSLTMAGCMESMRTVELRRDSDGAKAFCMSNVYAVYPLLPSLSEWKEKQYVAGCVASCIKEGIVIEARVPDVAGTEDTPVDPASEEKCIIVGKR